MAIPEKNINYTAADFDRYHSGTMNEAEMHALEKAALEDPFLAEALEGYAFTRQGEKDILKLKERLYEKATTKKRAVFFLSTTWGRVAAILILAAGLIFYLTHKRQPSFDPVLASYKKEEVKNTDSVSLASTDQQADTIKILHGPGIDTSKVYFNSMSNTQTYAATGAVVNNSLSATNSGTVNNTYTVTVPGANGVSSSTVPLADSTINLITRADINLPVNKDGDGKKQDDSEKSKADYYVFNGKIVDTLGAAIPFASISNLKWKTSVTTDAAGRFSIFNSDSTSLATIAATGYRTAERRLESNLNQTVVLMPLTQQPGGVVITENNGERQKDTDGFANRDVIISKAVTQQAGKEISQDRSRELFYKYVTDSLRKPGSAAWQSIKGPVILSFKINRNGEPYKIKIEKSLCDECDKEAIRLLTNGPKWKHTDNKRNTVTINF